MNVSKFSTLGFVLLRQPQFNCDSRGRRAFRKTAPKVNEIYYGGVDRMPWFDLAEEYYEHSLPEEMQEKWRELNDEKSPALDIRLTRQYSLAVSILNYVDKSREKNEICAIGFLGQGRESNVADIDRPIQWLGADIVVSGYGSIVCEGVFTRPDLFSQFVPHLNPSGLFDPTDEAIERYRREYMQIAATHNLERMPAIESLWNVALVGRIE